MNIPKLIRAVLDQPEPGLRDFKNKAELEAWFNKYNHLQLDAPNLCDDYSRETRALAEKDGFFMSCELVAGGVCYQTIVFYDKIDNTKPARDVFHIASMAILEEEEECWYVDLSFGMLLKLTNFFKGGKY